jgi:RNA polymerase sigma-70 factor (ECF subfamily)
MDPTRSDAELLMAHVAGDPEAFTELVRRHADRLWAVAVRTLGDPDEAEDAVQEALISALRSAGSFRGEAQVSTWLHRIVVNACLDRHRRRAARPTTSLPEELPAEVELVHDRDVDLRLDVLAALAQLPADQRIAVVLVELEQLSVTEAAELLGVPPGTIKSRCSRGRGRLALSLGHLRNLPGSADVPGAGGVR